MLYQPRSRGGGRRRRGNSSSERSLRRVLRAAQCGRAPPSAERAGAGPARARAASACKQTAVPPARSCRVLDQVPKRRHFLPAAAPPPLRLACEAGSGDALLSPAQQRFSVLFNRARPTRRSRDMAHPSHRPPCPCAAATVRVPRPPCSLD